MSALEILHNEGPMLFVAWKDCTILVLRGNLNPSLFEVMTRKYLEQIEKHGRIYAMTWIELTQMPKMTAEEKAAEDAKLTVALGLIMAGAMGNCYDRIAFGHVRDFVHFHVDSIGFDFAIFNFADNMLVAGAAILMLLALRPDPSQRGGQPRRGADEAAIELGEDRPTPAGRVTTPSARTP